MHTVAIPNTILTQSSRTKLADAHDLGCGNFLRFALQESPEPDLSLFYMNHPCRTFRGDVYQSFSLNELKRVSDEYAACYHAMGVRPKDLVAVYIGEGIENLIHFVALTSLGAIPSLVNGNMPADIAAGFVKKIGAIGLFTDSVHLSALGSYLVRESLKFVATNEMAASFTIAELPQGYPFAHDARDTVLVGHSSGTTGIPKAVIFQHQQFFHGIRYRLGLPRAEGSERILSALPHSHSAGIAYVMLAVLSGTPVMVLSSNRPVTVLSSIQKFRPTMVVAFPETYVELCENDFSKYDMSSIHLWLNGGDAAHEAHIRKLTSVGTYSKNGFRQEGSVFIDGLGSSEMGFSLFRAVHTRETNLFNRCIGKPLDWVDATVLGADGEKLPPYQIGRLGVKSPSITPGYWNDSNLTERARVHGYWLTGDMFYYDEEGRFYHVDRIPDVIQTKSGAVYSLQTEELLMKHCRLLSDCTVVGVPETAAGDLVPIAFVRLKADYLATITDGELLGALNKILEGEGKRPLSRVFFAREEDIPLGPTGKVLKRELREKYQGILRGGIDDRI